MTKKRDNPIGDPFDQFQKNIDQIHDYYRKTVSQIHRWISNIYDFFACKTEKPRHINKNEIFDTRKARGGIYHGGDIYVFFQEDDSRGRNHTKHAFSGVPVVVI